MNFSRSISKPTLSAVLCLFLFFGPGCLGKGTQTGTGAGLSPLANPSPGGMAGPDASSVSSAMGGSDVGITDAPSEPAPAGGEEGTFSDTPITVVGAPQGFSDKRPQPCDETGFSICFSGVKVTDIGPENGTDRRQYRIEGCLYKKIDGSGLLVDIPRHAIGIRDLLFSEMPLDTTSTGPEDCFIRQPTVIAGRPNPSPRVRLKAGYCRRVTTLDLPLPDPSSSPLTFDPCSSPGPTDTSTGDGTGRQPIHQTTAGTKGLDYTVPETPPPPPEEEPQDPIDRLDPSPTIRESFRDLINP